MTFDNFSQKSNVDLTPISNVYCGKAIWPHNEEGLENLARYIIRASFSQERMTYVAGQDSSDGIAKVVYKSKDGKRSKKFEALGKQKVYTFDKIER